MPQKVIPLEPIGRKRALEVLTLAFENDPMTRFLVPERKARLRYLRGFFERHLRYSGRYGQNLTTTMVDGVLTYLPPGQTDPGLWRLLRSGLVGFTLTQGLGLVRRSSSVGDSIQKLHKKYAPDPHYYILLLGVHPQRQGQGVGSLLLNPLLKEADAKGLPCYLETALERNITFYEKHGFQVLERVRVPQGSRLWAMRREAR